MVKLIIFIENSPKPFFRVVAMGFGANEKIFLILLQRKEKKEVYILVGL
jgi:hypothetical protein